MMTAAEITYYLSKFMNLVLILSLLPVGLAALVGLLVGLFQGVTQIQDQTLSFALRLLSVSMVMLYAGPWIGSELHNYAVMSFDLIIEAGTGK
ncbi:MAG: type III secretion system export apparatus subunit SctS [Aquisalimonadaceae bacterium]